MRNGGRYTKTTILDVLASMERDPAWLARRMNCHRTYIWKVARGDRPITERFVRDACAALNLPESALFMRDELRESNGALRERNEEVADACA